PRAVPGHLDGFGRAASRLAAGPDRLPFLPEGDFSRLHRREKPPSTCVRHPLGGRHLVGPPVTVLCSVAERVCVMRTDSERGMAELLSLEEAVARLVHDGDTVALEGFTHLIPVAAGQELIRQRKRDLTLVRMTPDIVY